MDSFLTEIEETIEDEGLVLIGHFMWILRGLGPDLPEAAMLLLCEQAYAMVRQRHRLRLMSSPWPIDLGAARPAPESTVLEFDLDSSQSVDTPVLFLLLEPTP